MSPSSFIGRKSAIFHSVYRILYYTEELMLGCNLSLTRRAMTTSHASHIMSSGLVLYHPEEGLSTMNVGHESSQ